MDGRLARQDRKAGGRLGRERGQSWAPLHAQVPDLYCLKPRGADNGESDREASLRFSREPGSRAQTGGPCPPACSGHQRAPSGRDRASPLLGSLPAVTGMETLGGVCRRISAPARVLPGDAPARPLPRVSPRLQKGQEARGAFHTTAGWSPVPSASVKQRPLTYDSDREKKDGPNLGMSQTWPRGTRPAALAGETSVSVRSRLPFRFEGFSNLIVRVSAVMAIDALSRQKPSALDGFTGCLGAPVGCAGHDGWLHGVTEPCSWPAFCSGGDCVLARPLPSAPAWLRCIKTQITADRSGRLQRDPDRSQVTSP